MRGRGGKEEEEEERDEQITAAYRGAQEHRGLQISSGFCRSGLHADFQWQLYMLTTGSGDADTNPN